MRFAVQRRHGILPDRGGPVELPNFQRNSMISLFKDRVYQCAIGGAVFLAPLPAILIVSQAIQTGFGDGNGGQVSVLSFLKMPKLEFNIAAEQIQSPRNQPALHGFWRE